MQFRKITDRKEAEKVLRSMPSVAAVDTEFTDLNLRTAKLLSIVVGWNDLAYSFTPELLDVITPALQNCTLLFMQNHVVDVYILSRHGCDLSTNNIFDTMLAEHLIDENLTHGLGDMVLRNFGDNYKKEFWSKYKSVEEAPEDEALDYECRDSIYTYKLGMMFVEQLRGKEALYHHVHRLSKALFETEVRGVNVNVELIKKTKETMGSEIESYIPRLSAEFKDYTGIYELNRWSEEISKRKTDKGRLQVQRPEFSFTSSTQIQWLVYDALQCPVVAKTKKGSPSTDYETLQALSQDYPILKTLVEYKGAKTIYSTFVEGMLDRVQDQRIFPRFNVNGTTTGRISHSNPNLGNIPREGIIRSFFIPDSGFSLIGADFSQLEVIVEANLTKDPNLIRILNEGVSKHDITAEGLGISRDQAKTLNFALQYGAGVRKVSTLLGVSHKGASEIFERYWQIYSGVKNLKDKTCKDLADSGAVTNIFGRTRHFAQPVNEYEKAKQERQAYNFLIQGVGADLCNKAFYLYNDHLNETGNGQTLWPIHDEVMAQVKPEFVEEEKTKLVYIMENLTSELNFEYPLKSKAWGPLTAWAKV